MNMNTKINWEILMDCVRYGKMLTDYSFCDKEGNAYRYRTFVHPCGEKFFISMCNGEIIYLRVDK